jgi:hypothetical protein
VASSNPPVSMVRLFIVTSGPEMVTIFSEEIIALSFGPGVTPPVHVEPSLHIPDDMLLKVVWPFRESTVILMTVNSRSSLKIWLFIFCKVSVYRISYYTK